MAEIQYAVDLNEGDYFIWASDYTRDFVNAEVDENSDHLQVLRCISVKKLDDSSYLLWFRYLNGMEDRVYVNRRCLVIKRQALSFEISGRVICDGCRHVYGDHYPGVSDIRDGISCHSRRSGFWFVPNEISLKNHHSFPSDDDFFAEMGL